VCLFFASPVTPTFPRISKINPLILNNFLKAGNKWRFNKTFKKYKNGLTSRYGMCSNTQRIQFKKSVGSLLKSDNATTLIISPRKKFRLNLNIYRLNFLKICKQIV
jgi:hypothetical protein